jgi:hypothetical protein
MYTQQQAIEMISDLVKAAQQQGGKFDVRDMQTGAVVATVTAYDTPTRPKDMPRALRPKQKLSKRQRVAARRDKALVSV